MNNTEVKLKYELCEEENQGVPVIVVAAGSSSRMGQNKQLIDICGLPVLVRTLKRFEECDEISNIILVARADDLPEYQLLVEKYMLSKVSDIIEGGSSRQESVLCGFSRLKADDNKVLIHDGARPLVNQKIIKAVIDGLDAYNAVVPVIPVKDTVKKIDKNRVVLQTVNRENLVLVQTPQGVHKDKYLEAAKTCDVALFTDDVSILEAIGEKVLSVAGDYKNIKITTPEDIAVAKAFLEEEVFE